MHLDELKDELTTLADEMTPFAGNVEALRRRERRRHVVTSAIAATLAVCLGLAAVAVIAHHTSGKIHVAGVPSKEVPSDEITHIDAIVVPATPEAKLVLDSSPLVERYALVHRSDRSSGSLRFVPNVGLCALQTNDGYAVDASTPGTDIHDGLQRALGARATAYDASATNLGVDLEIFMRVGVAPEYASAVLYALRRDPDVRSVRYVTTTDAYAVFKKDFSDQPALVERTKPSDLPESLRVILRPNRPVGSVRQRYAHSEGVDTIITNSVPTLFDPARSPKFPGTPVSPCAKP